MTKLLPLACLFAAFTLAGCPPRDRTTRKPYDGPTDPIWEVAKAVNANASKIKTVWARHDFDADIVDDKGKSHSLSGSGTLQFRKPGDLLLTAKGIIDYFEVGANDQHYWFTVYPKEVGTQWWGRKDQMTEEGARRIPIRPDLLLEVLGVHEIDEDFMQPPAPTMRVNNDQWAYMFVWNAPLRTPIARWVAVKEVWYDIQTKRPTLIVLFDASGRVVLRARLSQHEKIEDADAEMATQYDIYFPENKSRMRFRITKLMKEFKKGPARFPNDATFVLPEDPGVEKRIEIR
jgi:hypothetical protein